MEKSEQTVDRDVEQRRMQREAVQRALLKSVDHHAKLSRRQGLEKPYANYGTKSVVQVSDILRLEARDVIVELRSLQDVGYVVLDDSVVPHLELSESGQRELERLESIE